MEASSAAIPRIVTTAASENRPSQSSEGTYYNSGSSGTTTPEETVRRPGPSQSAPSTDEASSVAKPVVAAQPSARPPSRQTSSTMAGPASERAEPAKNPPRNSSIDSAISTLSTRSGLTKATVDAAGPDDIAHLIKTAGSAEAVIQYLLKEKQSQSQQNAQLWRLVDKQRAMILGLNKDLERALKDKEKYRKKLKEVLEASGQPLVPAGSAPNPPAHTDTGEPEPVASSPKERVLEVPVSPTSVDPDAPKHSPIDASLAPYPITPPANQVVPPVEPQADIAEILDPSHSMPKASEFALGNFDADAQEREADAASKRAEEAKDLPVNLGLPPSRTTPRDPREPPRHPPPQVPVGLPARSPKPEDNTAAAFPPPRKPPPAPLHLHNAKSKSSDARDESPESDTDYDHILEVDEERRGRRRTREEDDRERAILAQKEAELRSLSKKSKKSGSRKASEKVEPVPADMPASPRLVQTTVAVPPREPASLAGVLSGGSDPRSLAPPIMSPGLPASPRPMALRSPPLSPLGVGSFPGVPLSPRLPRGPIPLPPNTPLQTPSAVGEPAVLKSPRPLQIKQGEGYGAPSPTKSSIDSPVERTKIYRGFVTEEYPELLLPPNALPSIDIKVASSRMKPSRASLISLTQLEEDPVFTLAVYSRADGGELWRIEKDTASLAKLDQRLKQCPAFTAKTPDRSLFSGHAPAKLDARRNALNQYLDELLNTPLDNATALELCKYLSTNTLPPNADETGSSTGDSNSESHRTGPGGRPFRSGYLTKRGKNFGGWKARYFVLDGPLLKYYETPGGAHLGTIKLKGAQIGKQAHHNTDGSPAQGSTDDGGDNQYRHAFLILEPKKKDPNSVTKHVLCAESDKERDQWVDALLRWIDYRDPEDDESPKKEHASDRRDERSNAKKKSSGKQQQPQEESLIGVSYETTRQGDMPQGVPTRGKQQGVVQDHESTHSLSTTSSYTISAPRDPQVISNSESWGSKLGMGLTPPTQEEKKARKRSFFGFGPKARTSSDGQESLFGSESSSTLVGSQQVNSQYGGGPVRQAFGATLADAVRYNPPTDVRVPLPAVVYRCIQYLDAKNAIFEEGIFRLSGSNVVIKQLRERFNNEGDINLLDDEQFYDIHAIASLLKLYLRELPSTILTNELRGQFIAVTEMTNHKEKMAALAELVQLLPQANAALLKYLIAFLIKIIDHSDVNKMTVRNVGIVFSPTLNIPAPVFAMFLQNYEAIFGIHPSEYELPLVEDLQPPQHNRQERRPSLPSAFQERRPSDGRPSTSHGDSPHRQRLMEALEAQAASRGTPTPPPVMTMQQMAQMNAANMHNHNRSTPTPPPSQRPFVGTGGRSDELHIHHAGSIQQTTSMRPAYEGSYGMPPAGYEGPQQQQQGLRPVPSYDRPLYENGLTPAPYEQPYRSRRESMMLMGQLSQQGIGGASEVVARREIRQQQQPEEQRQVQPPGLVATSQVGTTALTAQTPSSSSSERSPPATASLELPHSEKPEPSTALATPNPTDANPDPPPPSAAQAQHQPSTSVPDSSDPHTVNPLQSQSTAANPESSSSSSLAAKKHRACEPCRALKVRCDPLPPDADPTGTGPCKRCTKTRKACLVTEPHQQQPPGRSPLLQQQQRTPSTAVPPGNLGAAAGQKRRLHETDAPGNGRSGTAGEASSFNNAPPALPQKPPPDVIDRGLLTMDLATELFQRYKNHMCPHLPAVIFPPSMTAAELRTTKPTLFLAIMAAACFSNPSVQRTLTHELMQVLADSIVVRGRKSLELVQALQVATIWYWPPDNFEELKFYQLVHMAVVMAIDLGLGRRKNVRGGVPRHLPIHHRDLPLRKHPPPDPTTLEARRAWITAYFLATNTSMALHRPNLLRWTPFMAECMDVLSSSPDAAPTDKYLVDVVWMHRLADEIGIHFSADDPAATPSPAEPRTQYLLRWFESKLERYRTSIPNLMQKPVLRISFHVISLFMHEIATYTNPDDKGKKSDGPMALNKPLTTAHVDAWLACLDAINGIFDAFLSLDVQTIRCLPIFNFVRIAYGVVVLIKLYFVVSSSRSELTPFMTKDEMKVEQHLERLLDKFHAAAADDQSRPAGKFVFVLAMLRAWFLKQEEKQRQSTAASSDTNAPTPAYPPQNTGARLPVSQPTRHADYSTASTPLQLLSEIATNDSGHRAPSRGADLLQASGPGPSSASSLAAGPWMNRNPMVYDPITTTTSSSQPQQQQHSTNPTPDTNPAPTPTPSTSTNATTATATNFIPQPQPPPASLSSMPWLSNTATTSTAPTVPDLDYPSLTGFGAGFGDGFVQAMDLTLGGFGFGLGMGLGLGDGADGFAAAIGGAGAAMDDGILGFVQIMHDVTAPGGAGAGGAAGSRGGTAAAGPGPGWFSGAGPETEAAAAMDGDAVGAGVGGGGWS
ncbi:hypothetical protein VTJ49DRAFT_6079 [Mycothermus thermophilus]|uniref:RhoGAP-domain-containing protein n=1 Tax=Humicola insolens TaxID=85995 RepID=A0ABR3VJT1_HUMIN